MTASATKPPPNNLKALVKEAKISQVALASKVGVDRGVIGRIIRGQQLPTRDQALWIAKALGTPEDKIFPEGAFRDHVALKKQDIATAERVLDLESKAASLIAENENLRRLQDEVVAEFSAELSKIHEDKAKLELQLADERNKNKRLSAEKFGLQFTVFAAILKSNLSRRRSSVSSRTLPPSGVSLSRVEGPRW